MNSKVMEGMNQTVAEWVNNPKDCRNVEQFTKDQIRAAIREFAEMVNLKTMADVAYYAQGNESGLDDRKIVEQALAAFGMEEK